MDGEERWSGGVASSLAAAQVLLGAGCSTGAPSCGSPYRMMPYPPYISQGALRTLRNTPRRAWGTVVMSCSHLGLAPHMSAPQHSYVMPCSHPPNPSLLISQHGQLTHLDGLGGQHPQLVDVVLAPRVHELDQFAPPQLSVHDPELDDDTLQWEGGMWCTLGDVWCGATLLQCWCMQY